MRVSREKAAENRARILAEAARLFRERGLAGIGVDALTEAAGLSHGSLYSRFGSKEQLAAAAITDALARSADPLPPPDAPGSFQTFLDRYLSARHRDAPGAGCALAALGCEIHRQGEAVCGAFTEGLRRFAARIAAMLPGGRPAGEEEALAIAATLVGAMVLARAAEDPELSDRILAAARRHLAGTVAAGASPLPAPPSP